ncbi:MAG: hypothetical protein ACFFDN_01995 [Candidatus Hodarchaeota archaeon]
MIAITTDSKIANLPLMKIASYYKSNVEWYLPLLHNHYEKIYYSKIFNFTHKVDREDEMIVGGTGYNLKKTLPEDIDKCQPDYSIYPKCNYSLQFFSRGCIRKCKFCVVPEKEGFIKPVEPMDLNPRGKYIEVLDNNFFASPGWWHAIGYLAMMNQPVNFHGVDIRILTESQENELYKLNHYKSIKIAWDNPNEKLEKRLSKIKKKYKYLCYVLIGYNSTPEQDLYRVEKLRELKIDPFVMPFNKKDIYQKRFARWVNHKAIFKTVKWSDYAN